MFKRILGINKIEKNFKVVGESLNRSWEWIEHFNKINSMYEERLARLEKSNIHLIELSREMFNQLQNFKVNEEEVIEEPVIETVKEAEDVMVPQSSSGELSDKDLFLLQLIHQYAAFEKDNAVDTNTLFGNLTYKITSRGLRKKLESLVESGFLRSVKRGNVRYWYFNNGALVKIKRAIKQKE